MKKRFFNWFKHIFVRYVPSSVQIAESESQRLSVFLTENYSYDQQLIILKQLKDNIVETRKKEIDFEEKLILNKQELVIRLKKNLTILTNK